MVASSSSIVNGLVAATRALAVSVWTRALQSKMRYTFAIRSLRFAAPQLPDAAARVDPRPSEAVLKRVVAFRPVGGYLERTRAANNSDGVLV